MNQQFIFNQAKVGKKLAVSFLLVIVLTLVLNLFSAQVAKAQAAPKIELSANSGPTGMNLTVRGFNLGKPLLPYYPYNIFRLNIVGKEGDNYSSIVTLGEVTYSDEGSFVWSGPIPRAGKQYSCCGRHDPPKTYTVPLGTNVITFDSNTSPHVGDNIEVKFTVTDNTQGPFSDPVALGSFWRTWVRNDSPISEGNVSRSYTWGPTYTSFFEPYKESPDGWRFVSYYDKTRMEVTNPNAQYLNNPYYVTNGLLVREMVTGQLQLGDNTFQTKPAAKVPTAGDLTPMNKTPTFAIYAPLQNQNDSQDGKIINQTLSSDGKVSSDTALNSYNVKSTNLIKETQHYIASPFWEFLNSTGQVSNDYGQTLTLDHLFDPTFSATGFPITEAYWTKTVVAGVEKDVLVQLFERRVLTYTPSNPVEFRVEMGNVGLQYYQWRYGN